MTASSRTILSVNYNRYDHTGINDTAQEGDFPIKVWPAKAHPSH